MKTNLEKRMLLLSLLVICFLGALLLGCSNKKSSYKSISGLDKEQEYVIKIAIPYETDKAINNVANQFMKKYPNVEVKLQYVENYKKLLDALNNKNVNFAFSYAHALKGLTGNLSLNDLYEAIVPLVEELRLGEMPKSNKTINYVNQMYKKVIDAITS